MKTYIETVNEFKALLTDSNTYLPYAYYADYADEADKLINRRNIDNAVVVVSGSGITFNRPEPVLYINMIKLLKDIPEEYKNLIQINDSLFPVIDTKVPLILAALEAIKEAAKAEGKLAITRP